MKLHEQLESLYVKTNIANQVEYHPYLASKINAIQSILNTQKSIYKYIAFVKVTIELLKIKLKLSPELPLAAQVVKEFQEECKAKAEAEAKIVNITEHKHELDK